MTLPRAAPALLPLLLLLASCASTPRPAPASGAPLAAASRAIVAKDDYPFRPGSVKFRAVSGEGEGKRFVLTTAKTDEPGVFTVDFRPEGAKNPTRVDTVRIASDSSVLLLETLTPDEKVISRYTPPMVILPAKLEPNAPKTQTLELTVHPVSKPDSISNRGKATHTLTLVGAAAIPGAPEALVVRAELTIKLTGANVTRATDSWYAPDKGLVAESYTEEIRVLGVFPKTKSARYEIEP